MNLAVTGKIVSDIESKNKAEDLFVEIQNYRNKLIEQGKLKKPKIHNRIVEADVPCELPKEWKWVRLGDIFDVTSSKRVHAKDYVQSGVPFFRSKEIGELGRGQDVATELFISQEQYDSYKGMPGFPSYGDLMLCSIGASIGNNWLCDDRAFYYKDGNITKIGAHEFAEMRYLKAFVDSDVLWQQVTDGVSGSAYNALTIIKIKNLYYPMPPLEEQKRIVAKVDELMSLCDILEKQLTAAYDQAEKLITATTKALVA